MRIANIQYLLALIASKICTPPFPEKEISEKIQSALKRAEKREKSLTQEIRDWISATWGNISATNFYLEQHIATSQEKKKCRVVFGRMVKEGLIERIPEKDGWYRRIDNNCEKMDFLSVGTDIVDIQLPFGLQDMVEIIPGNIILIAGVLPCKYKDIFQLLPEQGSGHFFLR